MRQIKTIDQDNNPSGWGTIPTVDGTLAGSTPATPTTPSTTQTAQGGDATAVESSQANILPAVPLKNFLIGGDGLVTFPWAVWFTKLHKRVGGTVSVDAGGDAQILDAFSESEARVSREDSILDLWVTPDSERDIDRGRWDDLRLGASVKLAGSNDPSLKVFRGGLRAWAFVDGAKVKEVFIQGQLPHSYMEGSDIHLHVHWGHISGVDNGAVVWQAEWDWTNVGEAFSSPTTSEAAASSVLGAEQYFQKITPIVTLPGAGKKISSILTIRLFRDPTHASDTSTADAFLFEVDAHYQLDRTGSKGELTKN